MVGMPGPEQALEALFRTRKDAIKHEKESLESRGSGRTDDPSARLRMLEMEEKGIDAMSGVMARATELQGSRLGGGDVASVSVSKVLKLPGVGMLESGSPKQKEGVGIDLTPRLDFGGLGGGSKARPSGDDGGVSGRGELTGLGGRFITPDMRRDDRLSFSGAVDPPAGALADDADERQLQRETSLPVEGGDIPGDVSVREARLGVISLGSASLAPGDRAQIDMFIADALGGDPTSRPKTRSTTPGV